MYIGNKNSKNNCKHNLHAPLVRKDELCQISTTFEGIFYNPLCPHGTTQKHTHRDEGTEKKENTSSEVHTLSSMTQLVTHTF